MVLELKAMNQAVLVCAHTPLDYSAGTIHLNSLDTHFGSALCTSLIGCTFGRSPCVSLVYNKNHLDGVKQKSERVMSASR